MALDLNEIQRKGFEEYQRFVNPLIAQRAKLTGEPVRMVRAEDGRLFDADGIAYEDFHGTQQFGHRHPAVTKAVQEFLATDLPNWYPSRVSPQAGRFARRLCERSGFYDTAFFVLSGSDTVEAAIKLARAATKRTRILGLEGAYHGCAMGSTALMARGPFRDPFGPHVPDVESLPFGDVDALARAFAAGNVAGVIVEPIQGEGGVRALPEAYLAALCELTEKHGALLVADEVQTGLGRTGRFLRSETWPRRPDAVTLAKALGGGLVPASALLCKRAWWERAYGADFEDGESHNSTFSYHALGAVAGLAALELLTDELMARVTRVGAAFRRELHAALDGNPLYLETRGEGLMMGVALKQPDHPWLSFEHFGFSGLAAEGRASIAPILCGRVYRRGFYCFSCGHDWSVFRLQPRFTIPEETAPAFAKVVREELDRLAEVAS